jgi:methanogenic corrinoid protein MtbC1
LGQEAIFDELVKAVLSFDADKVMDTTRKALSQGVDPVSIIDDGLSTKGLRVVGKKFEDGELFLMHLVAAAESVQRAPKYHTGLWDLSIY